MTTDSTKPAILAPEGEHFLCDDWFDPLENGVRTRIRRLSVSLPQVSQDRVIERT